MHEAIHQQGKDAVIKKLQDKYLPTTPTYVLRLYGGLPNESLDGDITVVEVRTALHELNTRSVTGPDLVTNKMIRNLDDAILQQILAFGHTAQTG